ncbi:hypothetical protein AB0K00_45480 [Dactylosporangium sp. NPDC049525]|uniref:hypothetical protein n=1 Tax=Dactylosporangium sp. NPDC049525 TaxID=3154730 RepID=UPI003447F5DF
MTAAMSHRKVMPAVDVQRDAEGGVTADVVDHFLCCGGLPEQQQRQQRDYAWDGGRFRQVDGPTVWATRATSPTCRS